MQLNDLRVNLTLDNSGFRLSVAESGRMLRTFEQSLGSTADQARRTESALSSFGTQAHRMIQSMGMARFALLDMHDIFLSLPKAIMGSAGEIERLTKLMEGLSTQTDATKRKLEAAAGVKFVFNMAQNAPFEVKSLTDTFVKLKTGGIDPMNGSMQALVDSVAKFGGSSEELHRASIAIMQMSGKGVISMEELRQQLGEAIPSAMAAMAAGMKMNMAQLNKAVSDGTVVATGAIKKMFAVMSVDNAGAAGEMMQTWTGMLERLKTQWEMWKLGVAGEGFAEESKKGLQELIDLMKSPEAASFGRRVGASLAETTKSIIDLAKTIGQYWEEVKTGAELIVAAYIGSKLMGPLTAARDAMVSYYGTITAGAANVRAALAMEAQGRRDQLLANATFLEETIAQNNAEIASNQATAEANRAIRARQLAETIASGRALLAAEEVTAAANRAIMAAALPSNSPAVAAVSRGTATAAQDVDAQILLRKAEAARIANEEITRLTASLQAEIVALTEERNALLASAGALTTDSEARTLANAHLATSAVRYREAGLAVTEANAAMNMMKAAGATVVGAVGSMIFSMGGLMVAIMAAAWAWNHFREEAQQAARDADTALKSKQLLEDHKYNEDTVKSNERDIEAKKDRISVLKSSTQQDEANYTPDQLKGLKSYQKAKAELEDTEAKLRELIGTLADGRKQVSEKAGEQAARDMVQGWSDGISKGMSGVNSKVNEINKEYADKKLAQGGKLTDQQTKDQAQELFEARTNALTEAIKGWDGKATELKARIAAQNKLIADGKATKGQREAAEQELLKLNAAANLVSDQRGNASGQLTDLNAPNDLTGGKAKKPKKETTDSVQRELASTEVGLDKLESTLAGMDNKVVDITALHDAVESHIQAIIKKDGKMNVVQKHTDGDEIALAKALEKKALLDDLKRQYGSLEKEAASVTDQFLLANEKMLTGNFDLKGKTKDELTVDILTETVAEMRKHLDDPAVAQTIGAYEKKLEEAQNIVNGKRFVNAVDIHAGNQKSIDALAAGNIVNDRARMQAQQLLETDNLRKKYDAEIATTKEGDSMRLTLQQDYQRESKLLAERHANDMKTPLEKLGDSWADVTKNMQNSTAKWADGAMDAFAEAASTGKIRFGDFAKSVIKDLIKIQLQAAFANATKGASGGAAGAIGSFVSGMFGSSAGVAMPQSSLLPVSLPTANLAPINIPGFANGGIMSSLGSMPLKKYSMGGIANSPQLALFGEGRMNEAYVPLPDGRSIPVTVKGGGQQQGGAAPNVQVNVINQTSSAVNAQQGQPRFDGKQMILDVVLTAASSPGSFRSGLKDAMK